MTLPTTAAGLRSRHPDWEFPEFDVDEYGPRRHDHCVVVFVLDEGERIRAQLRRMVPNVADLDVVIADGGSTDGSLDAGYLRDHAVRALLTKRGPGKLSAQMRMAFAWALAEGYRGVVVVDGNGKDDVSALPSFVTALDAGFDHVQGSRYVPGGHAINTPWERALALRLVHAPLISLATRHRHTDTTNGFRAYSSRLIADPAIAVFRDVFSTYELHYYLDIEASRRAEYRTTEIPVTRSYPRHGTTPTKISPLRGNLHVLTVLCRAVLGRYRPSGDHARAVPRSGATGATRRP